MGAVNFRYKRGFESANLSHNSVQCTVTEVRMAGFKLTMVLETYESVGGVRGVKLTVSISLQFYMRVPLTSLLNPDSRVSEYRMI